MKTIKLNETQLRKLIELSLSEGYYSVGDVLVSTVDAQGMKKGNQYEVVDKVPGKFGVVSYVVQDVADPTTSPLQIGNAHLVMKKVNESIDKINENANLDAETAKVVVSSFLDVLTDDYSSVENELVQQLDSMLGDDEYFPARIEDVESMAASVASHAAQMLVNAPGFKEWLADCVAKSFRKAF